ncbi:MAG: hypothetical protein WBN75_21140 [Verrucomicrobiia bacterium]
MNQPRHNLTIRARLFGYELRWEHGQTSQNLTMPKKFVTAMVGSQVQIFKERFIADMTTVDRKIPGCQSQNQHTHTTKFMTPIQAAILLMRILSVSFLLDVTEVFTELPGDIYGIFNASSAYVSSQRELAFGLALFRLLIYGGAVIVFLFFNRPLAKLFTKGLESIKHDDDPAVLDIDHHTP